MNTHHVSLKKMIQTKRQIKWNHTRNDQEHRREQKRTAKGQHDEHKPNFDYQVTTTNKDTTLCFWLFVVYYESLK